jgi:hypothetical protein
VTMRDSRLPLLFVRSRSAGQALLILTVVAVASTTALALTSNPDLTLILRMAAPLAAAIVVGAAVRSPFGEAEQTASHPLPPLRVAHLVLLLACGATGLALAGVAPGVGSLGMLLRNGAGFVGLALLGARLLGTGVSWLLPLGYGGATFVDYLLQPNRDASWRWPLQPSGDHTALALALTLLAIGLGAIVTAGSREPAGESA